MSPLLSKTSAEPAPTHVVMRPFPTGGRQLARGTKVVALDFLNLANLERGGFLARLPGTELDPHASKARAHQIREKHRLFGAALSKAEAEIKHQAEVKRTNARSQSERTLAAALGKIAEWCAAEVEQARRRLEAEILGGGAS